MDDDAITISSPELGECTPSTSFISSAEWSGGRRKVKSARSATQSPTALNNDHQRMSSTSNHLSGPKYERSYDNVTHGRATPASSGRTTSRRKSRSRQSSSSWRESSRRSSSFRKESRSSQMSSTRRPSTSSISLPLTSPISSPEWSGGGRSRSPTRSPITRSPTLSPIRLNNDHQRRSSAANHRERSCGNVSSGRESPARRSISSGKETPPRRESSRRLSPFRRESHSRRSSSFRRESHSSHVSSSRRELHSRRVSSTRNASSSKCAPSPSREFTPRRESRPGRLSSVGVGRSDLPCHRELSSRESEHSNRSPSRSDSPSQPNSRHHSCASNCSSSRKCWNCESERDASTSRRYLSPFSESLGSGATRSRESTGEISLKSRKRSPLKRSECGDSRARKHRRSREKSEEMGEQSAALKKHRKSSESYIDDGLVSKHREHTRRKKRKKSESEVPEENAEDQRHGRREAANKASKSCSKTKKKVCSRVRKKEEILRLRSTKDRVRATKEGKMSKVWIKSSEEKCKDRLNRSDRGNSKKSVRNEAVPSEDAAGNALSAQLEVVKKKRRNACLETDANNDKESGEAELKNSSDKVIVISDDEIDQKIIIYPENVSSSLIETNLIVKKELENGNLKAACKQRTSENASSSLVETNLTAKKEPDTCLLNVACNQNEPFKTAVQSNASASKTNPPENVSTLSSMSNLKTLNIKFEYPHHLIGEKEVNNDGNLKAWGKQQTSNESSSLVKTNLTAKEESDECLLKMAYNQNEPDNVSASKTNPPEKVSKPSISKLVALPSTSNIGREPLVVTPNQKSNDSSMSKLSASNIGRHPHVVTSRVEPSFVASRNSPNDKNRNTSKLSTSNIGREPFVVTSRSKSNPKNSGNESAASCAPEIAPNHNDIVDQSATFRLPANDEETLRVRPMCSVNPESIIGKAWQEYYRYMGAKLDDDCHVADMDLEDNDHQEQQIDSQSEIRGATSLSIGSHNPPPLLSPNDPFYIQPLTSFLPLPTISPLSTVATSPLPMFSPPPNSSPSTILPSMLTQTLPLAPTTSPFQTSSSSLPSELSTSTSFSPIDQPPCASHSHPIFPLWASSSQSFSPVCDSVHSQPQFTSLPNESKASVSSQIRVRESSAQSPMSFDSQNIPQLSVSSESSSLEPRDENLLSTSASTSSISRAANSITISPTPMQLSSHLSSQSQDNPVALSPVKVKELKDPDHMRETDMVQSQLEKEVCVLSPPPQATKVEAKDIGLTLTQSDASECSSISNTQTCDFETIPRMRSSDLLSSSSRDELQNFPTQPPKPEDSITQPPKPGNSTTQHQKTDNLDVNHCDQFIEEKSSHVVERKQDIDSSQLVNSCQPENVNSEHLELTSCVRDLNADNHSMTDIVSKIQQTIADLLSGKVSDEGIKQASDKKDATSNKKPVTSDKEDDTSRKKRHTSDKKDDTSNKKRHTSDKKEDTSDTSEKKDDTSDWKRHTSDKKFVTSNKKVATSNNKHVTLYKKDDAAKKDNTSNQEGATSDKKDEASCKKSDTFTKKDATSANHSVTHENSPNEESLISDKTFNEWQANMAIRIQELQSMIAMNDQVIKDMSAKVQNKIDGRVASEKSSKSSKCSAEESDHASGDKVRAKSNKSRELSSQSELIKLELQTTAGKDRAQGDETRAKRIKSYDISNPALLFNSEVKLKPHSTANPGKKLAQNPHCVCVKIEETPVHSPKELACDCNLKIKEDIGESVVKDEHLESSEWASKGHEKLEMSPTPKSENDFWEDVFTEMDSILDSAVRDANMQKVEYKPDNGHSPKNDLKGESQALTSVNYSSAMRTIQEKSHTSENLALSFPVKNRSEMEYNHMAESRSSTFVNYSSAVRTISKINHTSESSKSPSFHNMSAFLEKKQQDMSAFPEKKQHNMSAFPKEDNVSAFPEKKPTAVIIPSLQMSKSEVIPEKTHTARSTLAPFAAAMSTHPERKHTARNHEKTHTAKSTLAPHGISRSAAMSTHPERNHTHTARNSAITPNESFWSCCLKTRTVHPSPQHSSRDRQSRN